MPLSHFIPAYPSPPPHVLKSILYICVFIPVLPLGSSEPFFFFLSYHCALSFSYTIHRKSATLTLHKWEFTYSQNVSRDCTVIGQPN